jgi:hypothetical protein
MAAQSEGPDMIRYLLGLWHATNRKTDMTTLWPVCKQHASTLDHAKAAFYLHASNDTAWTDHYTEAELIDFVDKLQ